MIDATIEKRLWSKVKKTDGGCWEYAGSSTRHGYGRIRFRGNPYWKTHRVSWVLSFGEIPDGLCVCHACDNPTCVNPGHLFLGTHKDNMKDRDKKGRGRFGITRGSDVGNSKLTEGDVLLMRGLLDDGCKPKYMAWLFDVSLQTVSKIYRRQHWKHI